MVIGIVTYWFERGAAYVSRTYMDLLQAAGHKVLIFARGGEGHESTKAPEWNADNVTRYDRLVNTTIPRHVFFKWIKENGIQAILFNEQRDYKIVAQTKKEFPNIKLGAYVDYYTESSLKWFKFYDFLICNTKRHMQAMSDHPQKYYIKWGTDVNLYKPRDNENKRLTFFHSVGMSERKGTDILVDAFIDGKCYVESDLIIHTQIPISKVCRYSEDQLREYGITVIHKTVPAPGLYHLGDVYVYPTRLDGLGLTMYEALACGLPVITSDFPPMNEAVNDSIGKLISIRDYYCRDDAYYYPMVICDKDNLIAALEWYINNKNIINELKDNARKYAIKYYSIRDRKNQVSEVFLNAKVTPYNETLYKQYKKYIRQNFKPYPWLFNHRVIGKMLSIIKRKG